MEKNTPLHELALTMEFEKQKRLRHNRSFFIQYGLFRAK